jgi:hypothetical protein
MGCPECSDAVARATVETTSVGKTLAQYSHICTLMALLKAAEHPRTCFHCLSYSAFLRRLQARVWLTPSDSPLQPAAALFEPLQRVHVILRAFSESDRYLADRVAESEFRCAAIGTLNSSLQVPARGDR